MSKIRIVADAPTPAGRNHKRGKLFEHEDPGDRFIVATAQRHDLTLVTSDGKMLAYQREFRRAPSLKLEDWE